MGKRGPKPTPTATLKLRGSWRAGGRKDEPTPPEGKVIMPRWLKGEARKIWRRYASKLIRMGVLTPVDRAVFAAWCEAAAEYRKAQELCETLAEQDSASKGLLVRTSNGNLVQNPLVGIRNTARAAMVKLAAEFGMTPAARANIAACGPIAKTDDKDKRRFFNAG